METIIETVEDEGVVDEDTADLLQSALDFGDVLAYEVITPRVDLVAIDLDDSREEMLKKGFLAGRSNYAYQLRNYCEQKMDLPKRTCVVVSSLKRKEVEKKYKKMMKKYVGKKAKNYDVRYIPSSDFKFEAVDMNSN